MDLPYPRYAVNFESIDRRITIILLTPNGSHISFCSRMAYLWHWSEPKNTHPLPWVGSIEKKQLCIAVSGDMPNSLPLYPPVDDLLCQDVECFFLFRGSASYPTLWSLRLVPLLMRRALLKFEYLLVKDVMYERASLPATVVPLTCAKLSKLRTASLVSVSWFVPIFHDQFKRGHISTHWHCLFSYYHFPDVMYSTWSNGKGYLNNHWRRMVQVDNLPLYQPDKLYSIELRPVNFVIPFDEVTEVKSRIQVHSRRVTRLLVLRSSLKDHTTRV